MHHNGSLYCCDYISVLELIHPTRAIIKKALPGDKIASKNLERECRSYRLPGVASATCFRELYDVIDSHTIALEWLDSTLADVKYQPNRRTYAIIKEVVKEALTSCVVLDRQQYVNTGEIYLTPNDGNVLTNKDYKPANILISGVDTGCITVKVGDLGLGMQPPLSKVKCLY